MSTAGYLRISSDKQDVTRQRQSIEQWAARNQPIDLWFEDSEGRNSRDMAHKRKGFQALFRAVEAGLVTTIVVDSQDRFGTRDAYQWGAFLDRLRDNDCQLLDSSGRCLSADDDGAVLTGTVGALTSKREQREKAQRTITGKKVLAKNGQYLGGYPAYGFDVVCYGPDGKEKWRTLYVGRFDRWKVYPDGKRERYKGKDNTPRKDLADVQRYRPSIEQERLKVVRQIFAWYATESISPRQIATRLNQLKIDPIFGESWDKVKISQLLLNPIYLGFPSWNKRGGGRHLEYVGGQVREVPRVKGKPKAGRRRDAGDHIAPDKPEFKPIIDKATWDKVQAKIAASAQTKPRRPAQAGELWLRPLLVCGRCGGSMHSTNGRSTRGTWPSYFCSTYALYGPSNAKGCRCHRVQHSVLEKAVMRYLEESEPKIAKLLKAATTGNLELAQPLLASLAETGQAFNGLALDIQQFVDDHTDKQERQKLLRAGKGFVGIYGLLYERLRPNLDKQIADKEAALDRMIEDFRTLSPRLRERANEKMEAVQAEIDGLKSQLNDLREPWRNLQGELASRLRQVKDATHVLSNGSTGRQKTEALSTVVSRIICGFRHSAKKSYLDSVNIETVSGDVVRVVTDGSKPERD